MSRRERPQSALAFAEAPTVGSDSSDEPSERTARRRLGGLFARRPEPDNPAPVEPLEQARVRIGRVFKYLEELNRLKSPPPVHFNEYDWQLWLDELPRHAAIGRGADLAYPGARDPETPVESGQLLFKVTRPTVSDCPAPGVAIRNWLKPVHTQPGVAPVKMVRAKLKIPGGREEAFDERADRVEAFEDWFAIKRAWEQREAPALEAREAFELLFELFGKIQRESEKFQLYAADGILVTREGNTEIQHPLLLQRVALDFDAGAPHFVLRDTSHTPELHVGLLRFAGADGKALQELKAKLTSGLYHPFGGEDTSAFLRDVVQRLWVDGRYFENAADVNSAEGTYIVRRPHIFLGHRNHGFAASIRNYIEDLPNRTEFPDALMRVVGVDSQGPEQAPEQASDEDSGRASQVRSELLLTKPANSEQKRVLRRLEETGAVLVQGPPGTGKSHTIANLLGHLLAQNKSILVTSHTSKALKVVRQHMAPALQPLCVSVLEDDEINNKQLEESVSGIINHLSTTSLAKLDKQLEKISTRRDNLKREYDNTREELLRAMRHEYTAQSIGDLHSLPAQAARQLASGEDADGWIPGPVTSGMALPLSRQELGALYELMVSISAEDEDLLQSELPDLERLPTPQEFAAHFDAPEEPPADTSEDHSHWWKHEEQTPEQLDKLIDLVGHERTRLRGRSPWFDTLLVVGRQGGVPKERWTSLIEAVERCDRRLAPMEAAIVAAAPEICHEVPPVDAFERAKLDAQDLVTCRAILEHLREGGKLGTFTTMLRRDWKQLIRGSQVAGVRPSTVEHFEVLETMLEVRQMREELRRHWQAQTEGTAVLGSLALEDRPEEQLRDLMPQMRSALQWHEDVWAPLARSLDESGFDWERFERDQLAGSALTDAEVAVVPVQAVTSLLLPAIESRLGLAHGGAHLRTRDGWVKYLDGFSRKEASYAIVKQLRSGLRRENYDTYTQAWERLDRLAGQLDEHARRQQLLNQLRQDAAAWADALEARKAPHDRGRPPGDPEAAWAHRQWTQALSERSDVDLSKLQVKMNKLAEQLQEATGEYVEKLSWRAQLERTGLEQQQALSGWLGLHKKIGKGTGKHARKLKQDARDALSKCRDAVPVWIMPLSRAVESFDIATSPFDVVIVDEASQCDVMGLVAFAMAKEVIVVGDHEQVSPYAVGFKTDQMHALIDEVLVDIPNSRLYDAKTSVYDLARQSFGGTIRLLEHFRCVPDIIQFSNQLCYGGEIKPLREAAASPVFPHVVAHHVEGGSERNKVNKAEALEIASLVVAMTRMDEYKDSSIGVISMVGTEQALYIDSILRRRLTVAEYRRRRILCGNASQFQGDERDVVLLSMVSAPRADGRALHRRVNDDAKKVFNVAASRARDQLWVVHSLQPGRDLKADDLRLRLISHAESPGRPQVVDSDEELVLTAAESDLRNDLVEAGYQVAVGSRVGEFTIRLAVTGASGQRVAIQCEGDRDLPLSRVELDLDHQVTLQRLGWQFLRLRASDYVLQPGPRLKKLRKQLDALDVRPTEATQETPSGGDADLRARVCRRAQSIMTRWKDIPEVPAQTADETAQDTAPDVPDAVEAEVAESEATADDTAPDTAESDAKPEDNPPAS